MMWHWVFEGTLADPTAKSSSTTSSSTSTSTSSATNAKKTKKTVEYLDQGEFFVMAAKNGIVHICMCIC